MYNNNFIPAPIDTQTQQLEGYFNSLCQWTSSDGKTFNPANKSVGNLPAGIYEIGVQPGIGVVFTLKDAKTEELIRFPDANSDRVIEEIRKFWTKSDAFAHYGLPYKRGILLYGPPGSGKTCTVRFVAQDVQELGGIVINFHQANLFQMGFEALRKIQPETPVVVVMEDLDSLLELNNESQLLNLLDGFGNIDNTVFLATTNYPERLSERISNRPSRFDRRFEIGFANAICRKIYLEKLFEKLTPEDQQRIPEITQWVNDTAEMSLAHVKELFSAVVVLENSYPESLAMLKQMNEKGFLPGAHSGYLGQMRAKAYPKMVGYPDSLGSYNNLQQLPAMGQWSPVGPIGIKTQEDFFEQALDLEDPNSSDGWG